MNDVTRVLDDWGEDEEEIPCEAGFAYEKHEDWGLQSFLEREMVQSLVP